MMFRSVMAALLGTVVIMFSACNIQNVFLYFPDPGVPSDVTLAAESMARWPAGNEYRGLVSTVPAVHSAGTVVVFHGNAGNAADRRSYVKALSPLGYRVILAEYPKYGGRTGELGESAFVRDAHQTIRRAFEEFGGPFFLFGESLGCGVVAAVIKAASVKVDGAVLITPWDTLAAVAQEKFPFLPVRLLLTDSYDSVGNLSAFSGRVAVVGAERDEIIPVHHATALFNSLSNPEKRMWIIQSAGHNDWLSFVGPQWWRAVMDFVSGRDRGHAA